MNFNPSFYNLSYEVSSSPSNTYCFYDDSTISISNQTYSRKITGATVFGNPIEATVYFQILLS